MRYWLLILVICVCAATVEDASAIVVGDKVRIFSSSKCFDPNYMQTQWDAVNDGATNYAGYDVILTCTNVVDMGTTSCVSISYDSYWNGATVYYYKFLDEAASVPCGTGYYKWRTIKYEFTKETVATGADEDVNGDGIADCIQDLKDSDGDGIYDSIDPLPNDAGGFTWQKACYVFDAAGGCHGYIYKIEDQYGKISYVYAGEGVTACKESSGGQCYMAVNPEYGAVGSEDNWSAEWTGHDVDEDLDFEASQGAITETASGDSTTGGVTIGTYADGAATDGGVGAADGDSDSVLIGKAVNNTQAIAANQQLVVDGLADVANKMETSNRLLSGISSNGGASADDIGQAVADALAEDVAAVDGHLSDGSSDDAYGSAVDKINGDISDDDIPEEYKAKRDIGAEIGDIVSSSGLDQIGEKITGTQVTASGDCEITATVYGHEISLSMCSQASTLAAIGSLMQAVCGLVCILYIFSK